MARFHVAAAALIASASLLVAGCSSSTSETKSDKAAQTDYEGDAKKNVTRDLKQEGFDVVSVGPYAHEEPTTQSPVSAAFVVVQGTKCALQLTATPGPDSWVILNKDGSRLTPEAADKLPCT